MSPPSVLTPHGPLKAVMGLELGFLAPSPNSKVRYREIGIADRSGFGISVLGTWLLSTDAGLRTTRNSRNLPTQGSADLPERASPRLRSACGPLPSWCSQRFTQYSFWFRYFEKSITMSYRSAIPCSSNWVRVTGWGSRLPSLPIC